MSKLDTEIKDILDILKPKTIETLNVDYGWEPNHFEFDGNIVTGFSSLGRLKLQNCKDLYLPKINTKGEEVKEVGRDAFSGKKLTSLFVPDNILSLGYSAFAGNDLKTVRLHDSINNISGACFDRNYLSSVVLPKGLEKVKIGSFSNNELKELIIPGNINSIEPYAFSENPIESLKMEEGLQYICNSAFAYNNLKEVRIPNSMVMMDTNAFFNGDTNVENYVRAYRSGYMAGFVDADVKLKYVGS